MDFVGGIKAKKMTETKSKEQMTDGYPKAKKKKQEFVRLFLIFLLLHQDKNPYSILS